jgi:hypothetical protein
MVENSHIVIIALFRSAKTKHRHLCVAKSENICAHKAVSVVASTLSGSRSRELPFLLYHSKLENVAVSFVFESLVCNKSELV